MSHWTTGELIDDGFYCTPSADVQPLSPTVLQYWGLFASPFAPPLPLNQPLTPNEFYFRSAAHAACLSWLQNLASDSAEMGVITTSSGAGTTTFLRQLCSSAGIGGTAIAPSMAHWTNQSLDQLKIELDYRSSLNRTGQHVRSLWVVRTSPPSRLRPTPNRMALLHGWRAARAAELKNVSIVIVVRRTASISRCLAADMCPKSHHLFRLGSHELRRCLAAALHHAGGVRPIFTVSAVTHLADTAGGSIRRLGTLVHAALLHGHLAGLRQISHADLCMRLNQSQPVTEQARAA
jgi:hypothetical protein